MKNFEPSAERIHFIQSKMYKLEMPDSQHRDPFSYENPAFSGNEEEISEGSGSFQFYTRPSVVAGARQIPSYGRRIQLAVNRAFPISQTGANDDQGQNRPKFRRHSHPCVVSRPENEGDQGPNKILVEAIGQLIRNLTMLNDQVERNSSRLTKINLAVVTIILLVILSMYSLTVLLAIKKN